LEAVGYGDAGLTVLKFLALGIIIIGIIYYVNLNVQAVQNKQALPTLLDLLNKLIAQLQNMLVPQAGDVIPLGGPMDSTLTFIPGPFPAPFEAVTTYGILGSGTGIYGNSSGVNTPLGATGGLGGAPLPAGQDILAVSTNSQSLLGITQVEAGPAGSAITGTSPTGLPAAFTSLGLLGFTPSFVTSPLMSVAEVPSPGTPTSVIQGDIVGYTPGEVGAAALQSYGLLGYNPIPTTIYADQAKTQNVTPDVQTTIVNPIGTAARNALSRFLNVPIPQPISVSDVQNAGLFGPDSVPLTTTFPDATPTSPVAPPIFAFGGSYPLATVTDLQIIPALSVSGPDATNLNIPVALNNLFNFFGTLPPIGPADQMPAPQPKPQQIPRSQGDLSSGVLPKYQNVSSLIAVTPWGQPYILTNYDPVTQSYVTATMRDPYTDALIATYDQASGQYRSVTNPSLAFNPTRQTAPSIPYSQFTPIQNITPLQALVASQTVEQAPPSAQQYGGTVLGYSPIRDMAGNPLPVVEPPKPTPAEVRSDVMGELIGARGGRNL
jgi:hypothetical protein